MAEQYAEFDEHTDSPVRFDGATFWNQFERRFDIDQQKVLVKSFFRRDPVRLVGSLLDMSRAMVSRYFRTFQICIAHFRLAEAAEELSGLRRPAAHDVQNWVNKISKVRGRKVIPLIGYTFRNETFQIHLFHGKKGAPFSKQSGSRCLQPVGIVVTSANANSTILRQRSFELHTRRDRTPGHPQFGNPTSVRQFGNDLLAFLRKFKGIPQALFFDCLLEYEWKEAVKRHWMKYRFCTEAEHQFSHLRKLIRNLKF